MATWCRPGVSLVGLHLGQNSSIGLLSCSSFLRMVSFILTEATSPSIEQVRRCAGPLRWVQSLLSALPCYVRIKPTMTLPRPTPVTNLLA